MIEAVWLVLAAVSVVLAANDTQDCSQRALLACAYPSAMEQVRFAMKAEDLESNCPHLTTGLNCIDDYTRACLKPEQRSHFYRLYTGASMVLQEICTPGPYQDEFLRLAPCMNNVTEEYRGCVGRYEEALARLNQLVGQAKNGADKSEALHGICSELSDYLDCSKDVVLRTCGEDAAQFTAGFLDRMTNSLLRQHCVPKQAASSFPPSSLGVLLALALAYLL